MISDDGLFVETDFFVFLEVDIELPFGSEFHAVIASDACFPIHVLRSILDFKIPEYSCCPALHLDLLRI